jgi:hypothetical protein
MKGFTSVPGVISVLRVVAAAALCAVALSGTACGKRTNGLGSASIVANVKLATPDQVQTVRVAVTAPDIAAPIVQDLSKVGPDSWRGTLAAVPAGPNRAFAAQALGPTGEVLYQGSVLADLTANQTAIVVLPLQQAVAPADFANGAPYFTSLVASTSWVPVGGHAALGVTATDPDGDTLTYTWSATGGTYDGAGTATGPSATWTAPATEGSYTLTVDVADGRGGTASLSLTITVGGAAGQSGSADVQVTANSWPLVSSVTGTPSPLAAGQPANLDVTASDADGDTLYYGWASTCAGAFSPSVAVRSPTFTLDAAATETSCTFTATVIDGRGGSTTGSLTMHVGSRTAPTYTAPTFSMQAEVTSASLIAIRVSDLGDPTMQEVFTFQQSSETGLWSMTFWDRTIPISDDPSFAAGDLAQRIRTFATAVASFVANYGFAGPPAVASLTTRSSGSLCQEPTSCYDGDFACTGPSWLPTPNNAQELGRSPYLAVVAASLAGLDGANPFVIALQLFLFQRSGVDWRPCCLEHDRALWCGGTPFAIHAANVRLGLCIGSSILRDSDAEIAVVVGSLYFLTTDVVSDVCNIPRLDDPTYKAHGDTCFCKQGGTHVTLCKDAGSGGPDLCNNCASSPIEMVTEHSFTSDACNAPVPAAPGNGGGGWGDPHLFTFDKVKYDCQAVGELTLALGDDGLEVQARTAPWLGRQVSVNVAIAARVGVDRIGFFTGGTVKLNGQTTEFPNGKTTLPGGGDLYRYAGKMILVWPDNSQLHVQFWSDHLDVTLFVPDARKSHMLGLLGNFDGVTTGELVKRNGQAIADAPTFEEFYRQYVESWRVTQEGSLFDYEAGQTTETFTDRSFPQGIVTAAGLSEAERAAAEAICQSASVPQEWMDACEVDVASTGDTSFADAMTLAPPPSATVAVAPPIVTADYQARAQINTSNQILYQPFGGGGGTLAASGGDRIDKPSWSPYNVWSVWAGGNPIVLSGVLPDDIKYPVYLIINGIGTVNESTGIQDSYVYLNVNGTVVYDGKQLHLGCCNFDDWADNRIIPLIDANGNGLGGITRGSPYTIRVGASTGGTVRICVNALELSTTPVF